MSQPLSKQYDNAMSLAQRIMRKIYILEEDVAELRSRVDGIIAESNLHEKLPEEYVERDVRPILQKAIVIMQSIGLYEQIAKCLADVIVRTGRVRHDMLLIKGDD